MILARWLAVTLIALFAFSPVVAVAQTIPYPSRTTLPQLLLPSGGVIDWASGDVTLTHSANALTLAGGQVILPTGTAALPTLAFSADISNDSGLYLITQNEFGWSAGGSAQGLFGSARLNFRSSLALGWSSTSDPNVAADLIFARAAAGTVYLYGSSTAVGGTARLGNTNVGYEDLARNSEAHTLAAAGTSTTATAVWPATSASLGAAFRITTEITGCTSVQVGVAGDTTRYGTFSTLTAGQTIAIGRIDNYATATGILFTCVGGGASFTAGVVRVNLRYITASAPTS